eukprot:TRINITY_DN8154_c0_g1_i2.p1 TRINITY_DN8154_c0_g1~~TRINITY_DN8154_c0_g1_i2.p1  ORF type:complete len:183 (+),score=16.69 TRINITY_DN8154_c0_g1_i2:641-1189(+)
MPCSSGAFSCKSFYKELEGFPNIKASASLAWFLLGQRLSCGWLYPEKFLRQTTSKEEDWAISNICVLCGKVNETVDHLFVYCEFPYSLWCRFLARCGVLWSLPRSLVGLIEAWRFSSFFGSGLILWRIIPFAILWFVWKERNNRIFRGSLLPVEELEQLVRVQIAKWASFREFDASKVYGVA